MPTFVYYIGSLLNWQISIALSIYLSINPSVTISIYPSIYIYLTIYQFKTLLPQTQEPILILFNLIEFFISALHSYSMPKFVYNIASWSYEILFGKSVPEMHLELTVRVEMTGSKQPRSNARKGSKRTRNLYQCAQIRQCFEGSLGQIFL